MKTPYERAREVYACEPSARPFEEDLEAHMLHGFVFSRPDFFIMGRPVIRAASPENIVNPWCLFSSEACDCWHVFLYSGNPAKAFDVLPWPLQWVSFERKNELRFFKLADIARLSGVSAGIIP